MNNQQLNSLMLYALRYVLPRSTYAVSEVCEIVAANRKVLTKETLQVMLRDINETLVARANGYNTNYECDEREIKKLQEILSNQSRG